jgi:hypothetical protein
MPGKDRFGKDRFVKSVVKGILHLSEALELDKRMPADLEATLEALFEYRNKMFHNGFEWPVNVRTAFYKRISAGKWSADWFDVAMIDNRPWIFYMSQAFITHCMDTVDRIVEAIGGYACDEFGAR